MRGVTAVAVAEQIVFKLISTRTPHAGSDDEHGRRREGC